VKNISAPIGGSPKVIRDCSITLNESPDCHPFAGKQAQDASGSQGVIIASPSAPAPPKRKTKFTTKTINRVLKCVEQGMPLSLAAPAAGISYRTFCKWREQHPAFAEQVEEAQARGIEARLKVVELALKSPDESIRLRSATWYLEHVNPEHFAKNRVTVETAVVGAIEVTHKPAVAFDIEAYTKLCQQVFKVPALPDAALDAAPET
jgi:Transposase